MSKLLCLSACVGNYHVQVALPTSLRGRLWCPCCSAYQPAWGMMMSELLCLSACVEDYDVRVALCISLRMNYDVPVALRISLRGEL